MVYRPTALSLRFKVKISVTWCRHPKQTISDNGYYIYK